MAAAEIEQLLTRQEAEVRRLSQVMEWFRNGGEEVVVSPDLRSLREENERLKYRRLHLQRSLRTELARCQVPLSTGRGPQCKEWPSYIEERIRLYENLKQDHDSILRERAAQHSRVITVTLQDGTEITGESWRTTPYQIACQISWELAENSLVAKVSGELWDMDRPLEGDTSVQLLTFEDPEARAVYWHSSAHILGEALERYYGGYLWTDPPAENGFCCDLFLGDRGVSASDFPHLENICKSIMMDCQSFERLEVSKENLLEMFKYNKSKVQILKEKIDTLTTTVCRCGPLVDLCKGPHVRHTGKIKAFRVYKSCSASWEGKSDVKTLQRIYGISFPDHSMLKEWEQVQKEAKKQDHRKIGQEQELFFFHELSPGSCFFLPRGAVIYNTLMTFIQSEYRRRGFTEVVSPNIYSSHLWEVSGHWQHYCNNMFTFDVEKEMFALKPMNCPGHCLIFNHRPRSWRELPLRLADFGVLHRSELSRTLTGLTRVRRFEQDDGHIFCMVEQIEEEIKGCLDFLYSVYGVLGFTFQLKLSTRPEMFLGDVDTWNKAEEQLKCSLDAFGEPWRLSAGDGAFYGPKIDVDLKDALGRYHQCATIQLDFQLPIRFNLTYVGKDGADDNHPVIIHRAVLGSLERMVAILAENYAGKWPFWLSPRQVMVVPAGPSSEEYGQRVCQELLEAGFLADVDLDSGSLLSMKIWNAQLAQYNFIFVVGEKEKVSRTVIVHSRDDKVHGEHSLAATLERLRRLQEQQVLRAEEMF
ncbi:threonine--tRNA ligase 1, cytoplasmic-like isoform X1 [Hypanus sabinus]|uniref:threonine--tRNA ligase 1, cytoplasmic-like isoform X1 n=1 Tax=Hypanus sabinus TaxID=79690 RepID=UPI0028C395FE|nr:threonine--tRNA ligase 1, cytoplasmic-like isoform X1 [Hypanus sabinus]